MLIRDSLCEELTDKCSLCWCTSRSKGKGRPSILSSLSRYSLSTQSRRKMNCFSSATSELANWSCWGERGEGGGGRKREKSQFKVELYEVQIPSPSLTSPSIFFSAPVHSFMSWPTCPQISQGRGWLGLNSSRRMVKFGSCVASPSIIRSAEGEGVDMVMVAMVTVFMVVHMVVVVMVTVFTAHIHTPSAPHRQWCVLGS